MKDMILEHPIDTDIGRVICYRLRTTDEEWTKFEGRVSVPFTRGAKQLAVFYPFADSTRPDLAPFFVDAEQYKVHRGTIWAIKKEEDHYRIANELLKKVVEDRDKALDYYATLNDQICFLQGEKVFASM